MTLTNTIILLILLVEVFILTKLEIKIWKTHYTPLNILMLPYTIVLLITLIIPKSFGFVDFFYPSIVVWIIGLFIFFIPSLLIGLKYNKSATLEFNTNHNEHNVNLKPLINIIIILLFLSLFHVFFSTGVSSEAIGSDEFAEQNLSGGLWGHIREFLNASLVLLIFLFNKEHKKYIYLIVGILIIAMLNQVKSWIIIPLVAGFLFRLYTKKMKLNPLFILLFVILGASVFFLSYYLLMVYSIDGDFTDDTLDFIFGHFLHYLTSGVNGLSIDMQGGILETAHPEYVFAPFLNLINLITRNQMIVPISTIYHESGLGGTNVLTFFGTIFINLGIVGSIIYILIVSTILYTLKWYISFKNNIYVTAIYIWWCSLLFMGWFEFYFWNFSVIELPIFFLIIKYIDKYVKLPEITLR